MVIRNIAGDQNPYANKKIERPHAKDLQRTSDSARNAGDAADQVVLSSEGRLRGAALQTANETPNVRREKVDALKKQVQDGSYRPDIKKAAANLIREDLDLFV
ncbi:flagellar biosynthesis anti-sigma factor FlgM [Pseudodesulfovibrio sp. JC047]|uniref:flagellar biosynthesis anti-sigma factor FlgM n=1 Tax=Pseudodesulfovibrio sp. JC047 TaxID=2683199 RepID=UPI0013CF8682|nr:flagellar biosynthesis anti-sigma factor FlgM [Pseudodesulfovibrio sp. JC047]NDV17832.1 flagellar biosynthesis anti-sigma factor FlgM [Pseudodesulfovibrio sp. JC047]